MDNENKWEYDYSSLYGQSTAGSSYTNVGSSGTNSANRYNGSDGTHAGADAAPPHSSYEPHTARPDAGPTYAAGGATGYSGDYYTPTPPRKKKSAGSMGRTLLTLVLAAAVGFGGGWLGAGLRGGRRVVMQTVERDTSAAVGITTSTGGGDLTLPEVSALVSPSVVVITTEQMVATGNWFGMGQVQSGAGSGVIMTADGYILTCAHVVDGSSNIIVTIGDTDHTAALIGADAESDIAVLKIEADGLTPCVMADSDTLAVGEEVIAVGNPLGELGGTVTNGIISALNRDVVVEEHTMSLIQTNASVSPGNSGGGLFNMAGELIGIVNAKSADADAEGLGFAIPVNTAFKIAQQLIETGYVSGRPAMGITVLEITDAETAAYYGVSAYGVYVAEVTKGSGADKAGLQAGDRIISIDGTEVNANADLTNAIAACEVGDVVSLTIARKGQIMNVEVTLGDRNASAGRNSNTLPQLPGFGDSSGSGRR